MTRVQWLHITVLIDFSQSSVNHDGIPKSQRKPNRRCRKSNKLVVIETKSLARLLSEKLLCEWGSSSDELDVLKMAKLGMA